MSIKAIIVADSLSQFGDRLTTFELIYPRIIHAEFMTHRVFSRNAASSRAIPSKKLISAVMSDPFIPIEFQKTHSGMQGNEVLIGEEKESAIKLWLEARDNAIKLAESMLEANITKQIVNRILEPFQYYKTLITATEFENFFALRAHKDAEIHIQKLAEIMLDVYNTSIPQQLLPGDYHLPYGDRINEEQLFNTWMTEGQEPLDNNQDEINSIKVKIAVARCARTSYTVVGEEGKPDNYDNDIKLHDRLISSGHMSPTEHIGICLSDDEYYKHYNGLLVDSGLPGPGIHQYGWSGNFKGFKQYRKTLTNENRSDSRVKTYYKLKAVSKPQKDI